MWIWWIGSMIGSLIDEEGNKERIKLG